MFRFRVEFLYLWVGLGVTQYNKRRCRLLDKKLYFNMKESLHVYILFHKRFATFSIKNKDAALGQRKLSFTGLFLVDFKQNLTKWVEGGVKYL